MDYRFPINGSVQIVKKNQPKVVSRKQKTIVPTVPTEQEPPKSEINEIHLVFTDNVGLKESFG